MQVGIDQLHVSPLRPPETGLPSPDMRLIDRARLYGLATLPAIKVRQSDTVQCYEILSGLLTWRVAQRLRIDDIDVELLDVDDSAAGAMVRGDVGEGAEPDPISRAESLRDSIEVEGLSRNMLCRRYGLSKSQLSHSLRLLRLEPTVREWVRAGRLSAGKAKVLVTLPHKEQARIAQLAIEENLNTRQVEGEIRNRRLSLKSPRPDKQPGKDSNTKRLEAEVSERLGNPVTIDWDAKRANGRVSIQYFGLEELQAIVHRLKHGNPR